MIQKLIAGLLVTRSMHPKDVSTRVPTQITCQIFKEHLRRQAEGKGRKKYALRLFPSTRPSSAIKNRHRENRGRVGSRARIIGPKAALSTDCNELFPAALERCFSCRFIALFLSAGARIGAGQLAGCAPRQPAIAPQHPKPSRHRCAPPPRRSCAGPRPRSPRAWPPRPATHRWRLLARKTPVPAGRSAALFASGP